MDDYDVFETIQLNLDAMEDHRLARVAEYALGSDWFLTSLEYQTGRDDTVDRIAQVVYSKYFDSGASDEWGPSTFLNWFLNSAFTYRVAPTVH